ncbi:hypothetical protein MUN82_04515 [Hymenobacter aerilatus]|uniref:Uncharacterized protein n=1 Tax=Hymenobacter aerilatus TaxID=2932251 RepID=A0A8T9SY97_9BACT|nr:hypothetical protein [Hymenobacter aerilatus]UOR06361.1 hypothetical protein MUN82_04515 [Hymenobacter aerilatus]
MNNAVRRIVPFDGSYAQANKHFTVSKYLAYFITAVALTLSIIERNKLVTDDTARTLGACNALLVIAYLVAEYRGHLLYVQAETKRRFDFVDNSFGTTFSEANSEGYYTNTEAQAGLYRMALNNFENSFTSQHNLDQMLPKVGIKNGFIVAAYCLSAAIGDKHTVRVIAESIIAASFALELIKLWYFTAEVRNINLSWRTLFQDTIPDSLNEKKVAQMVMHVLRYETIVAWASIPLDMEFFGKNRERLDDLWKEQKKRLGIS